MIIRGTGKPKKPVLLAMDSPLRPSTEFRIDRSKTTRDRSLKGEILCHETLSREDTPWLR
jgi:hypothetical protein